MAKTKATKTGTKAGTMAKAKAKKGSASAAKAGTMMVVGGGVAGVQAALDLTDLGYYVYLIEKTAAVGGAMAQLDKTFPTNDCSL
jgi:heterodisulfide reductase subunit A-like polyferredoxin